MNENHLAAIERVARARHKDRLYTTDIIARTFADYLELKGDRRYADDPAIVGGMATLRGRQVMVIGHQKGRDVNERRLRNFGSPKPEGYRKALRLMKLAEKFGHPVITFIDTPGAYPGIDAEERGQAEAIAYNLVQAAKLKVPIITVVVGEGGSGGALAIGVCDVMIMLENAVYSVISPEGCAAILWKSQEQTSLAAEKLKLTATDLNRLNIIDAIIAEDSGEARLENTHFCEVLSQVLHDNLLKLEKMSHAEREAHRYAKLRGLGRWLE